MSQSQAFHTVMTYTADYMHTLTDIYCSTASFSSTDLLCQLQTLNGN